MKRTFLFISLIVQFVLSLLCPILYMWFLSFDIELNTSLWCGMYVLSEGYIGAATYCLFPFGRKPKPYELPLNLSIAALIFIANIFLYAYYECFALVAVYGILALFDIWAAYKTHKNGVIKNA